MSEGKIVGYENLNYNDIDLEILTNLVNIPFTMYNKYDTLMPHGFFPETK